MYILHYVYIHIQRINEIMLYVLFYALFFPQQYVWTTPLKRHLKTPLFTGCLLFLSGNVL